jgi:hypothetical protein
VASIETHRGVQESAARTMKSSGLRVKSGTKAGGISFNHNKALLGLSVNHNRVLLAA